MPSRNQLLSNASGVIDPGEIAAVFVGGAVGAITRVAVARAIDAPTPPAWPWATFSVNIAGALLLGYVATRFQERRSSFAYHHHFLGVGLCGGLTTFSTFQLEILKLIDAGDVGLAIAYAVASIACGLAAVAIAAAVARRVKAR